MEQMAEPCPVILFHAYLPVCGAVQYDFGLRWDRGCRVECECVVRYPFIFAHDESTFTLGPTSRILVSRIQGPQVLAQEPKHNCYRQQSLLNRTTRFRIRPWPGGCRTRILGGSPQREPLEPTALDVVSVN
ncbi:hypothetical protein L208DRAFT_147164 [Tricholoma matsutake]|nr:hypothetical protein L208DRAFT_147164 [Tricholoma matsutake 945]